MPEIRPGAIISRAFQIYRDQVGTLLGAALIIFGIQFLLALLLPKLFFIAGLAAFILSVFYGGMVVNLVRDVQDGRRDHSTGELFRSVTPVLLPLLGLAIVAGIGIAIGFVLIIIPGLILLTIWAVAAPVMVIEHPGVFAALGRSRDLGARLWLARVRDDRPRGAHRPGGQHRRRGRRLGAQRCRHGRRELDRRDADGADLRPHLGGPVLRAPRRQGGRRAVRARRALAVRRRAAAHRMTVSARRPP